MRARVGSISFARSLRRNQTDAEKLLWMKLRNRQLDGIKFRRQQPMGSYVVDFISFEKKLIIEIDGGQHNTDKNRQRDIKRATILEVKGYRVLRFWNNEVLNNLEGVLDTIKMNLIKE